MLGMTRMTFDGTTVSHRTLPYVTWIVVGFGIAWLITEGLLRGAEIHVTIFPSFLIVLSSLCVLMCFVPRARMKMDDEVKLWVELGYLMLLAVFSIMALLMAIYVLLFVLSVIVTGLLWIVWFVVVILAVLLQLLIWGLVLGAVIGGLAIDAGGYGKIMAAVLFLLVVLGIIFGITSSEHIPFSSAFDFTVVGSAWRNQEWLPNWLFILSAFRFLLSPVSHERLVSTIFSVLCGLACGFVLTLMLRWLRLRLAKYYPIREFLPLQVAPSEAGQYGLETTLLTPILYYTLGAWLVLLVIILS